MTTQEIPDILSDLGDVIAARNLEASHRPDVMLAISLIADLEENQHDLPRFKQQYQKLVDQGVTVRALPHHLDELSWENMQEFVKILLDSIEGRS